MDLFVANIDEEIFSLYQNNKDLTFDDVAVPLGIGMATRWMSGWGLKFFDYDNDGNLDLILANGFPDDLVEDFSDLVKYHEPLLLFKNTGNGFKNVSERGGPAFSKSLSARGLAVGDFNNDGAVDVLIAVNDSAPVLLRNNAGTKNHWLGIKLVGTKSNADAVGARVTYQAGDLKRGRMKVGGAASSRRTIRAWSWESAKERKWIRWRSSGHGRAEPSASQTFPWTVTSPLLKVRASGNKALRLPASALRFGDDVAANSFRQQPDLQVPWTRRAVRPARVERRGGLTLPQ